MQVDQDISTSTRGPASRQQVTLQPDSSTKVDLGLVLVRTMKKPRCRVEEAGRAYRDPLLTLV